MAKKCVTGCTTRTYREDILLLLNCIAENCSNAPSEYTLTTNTDCCGQEICLTKDDVVVACFTVHEQGAILQSDPLLPNPTQAVVPVTWNVDTYELAQADSADTLAVFLAISSNLESPTFGVLNQGFLCSAGHGLTVGEWYALSTTTAGELVLESTLDPETDIIQRVLFVISEDCVYLNLDQSYLKTPVASSLCVSAEPDNITTIDEDGCIYTPDPGGSSGWALLGNAGTSVATNYCGTSDDEPFALAANGIIGHRLVPQAISANIIAGHPDNYITGDFPGAAILSGGVTLFANSLDGSGDYATICGGQGNYTLTYGVDPVNENGAYAFIGGGALNSIQQWEDYAGSGYNTIVGGVLSSIYASSFNFIGGGNTLEILADGVVGTFSPGAFDYNVIVGGDDNVITWDVVDDAYPVLGANAIVGGTDHLIESATYSFIGGGLFNQIQEITASDGPMLFNTVAGGYISALNGTQRSVIGGGGRNTITFEDCSGIFSGASNLIISAIQPSPPTRSGPVTYSDPPGSSSVGNVILGGVANTIDEGWCSSILGGGYLALGQCSTGFQAVVTLPEWDPSGGSQVDLTGQGQIAYFGDVDMWLGNVGGQASKLFFWEPNTDLDYSSAHRSSFEAQAQAANIRYILPAAQGVVGNSLKIAGVSGTTITLEWAA